MDRKALQPEDPMWYAPRNPALKSNIRFQDGGRRRRAHQIQTVSVDSMPLVGCTQGGNIQDQPGPSGLHHNQPTPPPGSPSHPQMPIGQPNKKIQMHEQTSGIHQPLEVDVEGADTDKFEDVSPPFSPDDATRPTKEDLLKGLSFVQRDIAQTEHMIKQLQARKAELERSVEEQNNQTPEPSSTPSPISSSQQIYVENRKKAQEAHDQLGPDVVVPLYNQPSDTSNAEEAARRHVIFRPLLTESMRKKAVVRSECAKQVAVWYGKDMTEFHRTLDEFENSPEKKASNAKSRELFEKVFPQLRKQREERERSKRRAKSDADLQDIMDKFREQEMKDKKMKSSAVVPPVLWDHWGRRQYINNNGRIHDMRKEMDITAQQNNWTSEEHEVFCENYVKHPKNFGVIASFLEGKSVNECIRHYYLTKKQQNYKQMLQKSRQPRIRASRRNSAAAAAKQVSPPVSPQETPAAPAQQASRPVSSPKTPAAGVPTRLRRKQSQKSDPGMVAPAALIDVSPSVTTAGMSSIPVIPTAAEEVLASETSLTDGPNDVTSMDVEEIGPELVDACKAMEVPMELETSNEDNCVLPSRGSHNCIVCQVPLESFLQSRYVPRKKASQYCLKEKDTPVGARVCDSCRYKSLRSRSLVCPIPTCPNDGATVKELQTIAWDNWDYTPTDLKSMLRDFRITTATLKCCSACYSRICRRLGPVKKKENWRPWNEEEVVFGWIPSSCPDASDTAWSGDLANHRDIQNVLNKEPARAPESRTPRHRDDDSSVTEAADENSQLPNLPGTAISYLLWLSPPQAVEDQVSSVIGEQSTKPPERTMAPLSFHPEIASSHVNKEVAVKIQGRPEHKVHHSFALPTQSRGVLLYPRETHFNHSHLQKQPVIQTLDLVMSHSRPQHVPQLGMIKLSPKMMRSLKPDAAHAASKQQNPRPEVKVKQCRHKDTAFIKQVTPIRKTVPSATVTRPGQDHNKRPTSTSSGAVSSNFPPPSRRPVTFPLEHRLKSRQTIRSDYITSQQMQASRKRMKNKAKQQRHQKQMSTSMDTQPETSADPDGPPSPNEPPSASW